MRHLHVRPLQPRHDRRSQIHAFHHTDQALRNGITPDNTAKDIHENRRHFRVRRDKVKRLLDSLRCGAAADVEEVGGLAAVELDDVHGGHGKASAVDEAADVAVEFDKIKTMSMRVSFGGASRVGKRTRRL